MSPPTETRSVRATALEVMGLSVALLALASLPFMFFFASNGIEATYLVAAKAGELLYSHIGWALTLYVTILLAFYAVSFGGQVLSDGEDTTRIDRVRRILGAAAGLIAAVTFVLVAFIIVYCSHQPAMWASTVVIVPAFGIIVFLSLQLGGFVVFDRELRLTFAKQTRHQTKVRLEKLQLRSRHPIWAVGLANAITLALIATLISALFVPSWAWLQLYLLFFIGAVVLLSSAIVSLQSFYSSGGTWSRVLVWALPFIVYAASVWLAVIALFTDNQANGAAQIGRGITFLLIGTAGTLFWPRRRSPRWALNWSIQGACARSAALTLAKSYNRATREILELSAEPAATLSLRQRLLNALPIAPKANHRR